MFSALEISLSFQGSPAPNSQHFPTEIPSLSHMVAARVTHSIACNKKTKDQPAETLMMFASLICLYHFEIGSIPSHFPPSTPSAAQSPDFL